MPSRGPQTVKLSASRLKWLQSQVDSGEFRSVAEAADHYLRRAAQVARAKARIDRLLLEGLNSGPPIPVDDRFWTRFRADLRERVARGSKRKSA